MLGLDVSILMLETWLSGAVLGPVAMLQNVDCCYLRLCFLVPPGFWKVASVLISAWHTLVVVSARMPFSVGSYFHAHSSHAHLMVLSCSSPRPSTLGTMTYLKRYVHFFSSFRVTYSQKLSLTASPRLGSVPTICS